MNKCHFIIVMLPVRGKRLMPRKDRDMERRTNEQWKRDLRSGSPEFERAVAELRRLLIGGLGSALSVRKNTGETFIEDVVQEAVLRIIERIDTFEGKSRFSTWATKVAVRVALTELRHRHWKDVSFDEALESGVEMSHRMMGKPRYPGPEAKTIQNELVGTLARAIETELTANQRKALAAVRFAGMPMSEVAGRMGTSRNALYKMLHDARAALKKALLQKGLTPSEILEAFQT